MMNAIEVGEVHSCREAAFMLGVATCSMKLTKAELFSWTKAFIGSIQGPFWPKLKRLARPWSTVATRVKVRCDFGSGGSRTSENSFGLSTAGTTQRRPTRPSQQT